MAEKARHIGPYSRPHVLAKMDGRTREAMLLRRTREQLVEHVGGAPSIVESALIDRAAQLTLFVAMLDAKIARTAELTPHDERCYTAWSGALIKTLIKLGVKGKAEPPGPSLQEYLAAKHGAVAAA